MTLATFAAALPDPVQDAEFYDGVPAKRLIAWALDVAAITVLTVIALPFTAFTGLFFLLPLYLTVGFLYRWAGLAAGSATPGMRLTGIELRAWDGRRLDPVAAFLHVAGYTGSVLLFPAQFVSAALMAVTPRGQGLTDLVLGTAALRRCR